MEATQGKQHKQRHFVIIIINELHSMCRQLNLTSSHKDNAYTLRVIYITGQLYTCTCRSTQCLYAATYRSFFSNDFVLLLCGFEDWQ